MAELGSSLKDYNKLKYIVQKYENRMNLAI